jgi:flavodoxin
MKSLIVYSSKSGNTKKIANAIENFLPGEKVCLSVEDNPSTSGYDLICVGFWFQSGNADKKSAQFLESIHFTTPVFLFATHGAAAHSEHAVSGIKRAEELLASNPVVGVFSCQGEVNGELLAQAKKMTPPPPWIDAAPQATGHPNSEDISRLEKVLGNVVGRL